MIETPEDIRLLKETVNLECKLALGRDGKGSLPKDFWPTYSAFANTEGGTILLGVREKKQAFELEGIPNLRKVKSELISGLNNLSQVSTNLLSERDITEVHVAGKVCLSVNVPRAPRQKQPVHLTKNPFDGNTFRRFDESDLPLTDEEVRRLIAESVEDSRDDQILVGYGFGDLSLETVVSYRQVFGNRDPGHPWNTLSDEKFMRQLGE